MLDGYEAKITPLINLELHNVHIYGGRYILKWKRLHVEFPSSKFIGGENPTNEFDLVLGYLDL